MSNEEATPSVISPPVNDNGVKLPYFHRKLSQEDANLLGDITPKRIDSESAGISNSTSTDSLTRSLSVSSAWNQGTTWEERNCTKWATETITKIFSKEFEVNTKVYTVEIVKVDEVKGNASVTHSRGKPRYLYEFSFDLHLTVSEINSSTSYSGVKVKVIDAINDQLDVMETELQWGSSRPNSVGANELKKCCDQSIRDYIVKQLKEFENEFRKI